MDAFLHAHTLFGSLAANALRLVAWLLILAAVFIPLERIFAARRKKTIRSQLLNDIFYFFGTGLLVNVVLVVPMAASAMLLHHVVPGYIRSAAAGLPFGTRVLASLLVVDLTFYWLHRMLHEVPFLWRFHALHHSASQMDWLVNTRTHPVETIIVRLTGFIMLYACGLATPTADSHGLVPGIVVVAVVAWGFFVHANVKWRFGWLESVLSTPAFHHWHHANDARRDSNYAAMLPWLDRLFGTLNLPGEMPSGYGIDESSPETVVGQLCQPFAPRQGLSRLRNP